MTTRKEFVDAARSCLDTKFHHQGRLKGVGLDCAGLVIVAASLVGIELSDMRGYGRIPDGSSLLKHCDGQSAAEEVSILEAKEGEVILMAFNKDPQHLAIISKVDETGFDIVHSWLQARKVAECRMLKEWEAKIIKVSRVRGGE